MTGSPVYTTIISVSSDDQLWSMVESGEWDWLGPDPEGRTLLGWPAHHGPGSSVVPTVAKNGAEPGHHGVEIAIPGLPAATTLWWATEDQAKAEYSAQIEAARSRVGLAEIRRTENGKVMERKRISGLPSTQTLLDSLQLTLVGVLVGIALAVGFGLGGWTGVWAGAAAVAIFVLCIWVPWTRRLLVWASSRLLTMQRR